MIPTKSDSLLPLIQTKGLQFIDSSGRQVILHGANLVNKNPRTAGFDGNDRTAFARMRSWGFNCVRLGVIWDGLEPNPGEINQEYIQQIDQRIDWAEENQLYVILDMHQDLYSTLFSDGAPAWATLTDEQPHIVEGGVWSDAYFTSPAVQAALDHFWDNAPAPDGTGLQDHYAACWVELARRYSRHLAVIGYDLMNEPFPGSSAVHSQILLFSAGAEALREMHPSQEFSAEELMLRWLDPHGRNQILSLLEDPGLYSSIVDATYPIYSEFERTRLLPFYQKVADAIRTVDKERILFLETSMGSNMGVYSALEPLINSTGASDRAQAYAPHGYDLVVDTPYLANASPTRVELIFNRHTDTQKRLGLPMIVGEWGAFDRHISGTLPAAWAVSRQFERILCSDTYWHYERDLDQLPPFQAISRPYPERVSGRLVSYHCAEDGSRFDCSWDEELQSESIFYVPDWFNLEKRKISLEPFDCDATIVSSGKGNWLSIPASGSPCRRSLHVY